MPNKQKEKKNKRMVIVSDFHCGHEYGLTPPDWWARDDSNAKSVSKAGAFQRELWQFYSDTIKSLQPIDILVVNGDCIEGKGQGSGGIELITADRNEQVRMACKIIKLAKAKKVRILYGTRYHVGKEEDFESPLVDLVGGDAEIHGHDFFDINGLVFDIKHKLTGSTVPHGRITSMARARLWNVIWNSEHQRQPKADILIRSHVHYHQFGGGPSWLSMTTPALCYNSSFGIRECEGLVDVGMIFFDIDSTGGYEWQPILAKFPSMQVRASSL